MMEMHNEQYERALKAWAGGQESTLLQEVFASWKASHREEVRNRELEIARAKMLEMHNEQYERALKAWAGGQESTLLQEVLASWKENHREELRNRELEMARAKMMEMHNEQYERALKAWAGGQ